MMSPLSSGSHVRPRTRCPWPSSAVWPPAGLSISRTQTPEAPNVPGSIVPAMYLPSADQASVPWENRAAVSPGALTASPVGVIRVSADCPGRTLKVRDDVSSSRPRWRRRATGGGNANRRASGNRHAEQSGQGPVWRGVSDFSPIGRPRQRGQRLNNEDALRRAAISVDDPDGACVSPTRHEGDSRAVWRPGGPLVDRDAGCHLPWVRAVETRRPDISAAAANGCERDSVPTW